MLAIEILDYELPLTSCRLILLGISAFGSFALRWEYLFSKKVSHYFAVSWGLFLNTKSSSK
jgi:hypothetical protein